MSTTIPGTAGVQPALNQMRARRPRSRDLGLGVLLLAATFLVYFPALRGGFLLDDDVHVTTPELRSVAGLVRIWTDIGATQQYYPVVHTAFWLEHRAWGDAVVGYHLVNVLLHVVAALLVVAVTRRLNLRGGWLAAFVFALHPVCVESVAWISEQKNTFSTVFYLAAALVYFRFRTDRSIARYVIATVLFAGALLSKTATATLPAVLLVVAWWQRGRLDVKRDVVPLLPWFAAAIGASVITLSVERELIAGINANLSLSVAERIIVAGHALWFYLGKLVWPANLSFLYERWEVDATSVAQGVAPLLVVAVAFLCMWRARDARAPLATLLIYAGTLAPVLGFIDVEWFVFSYVADHFQYLALLGVFIPAAAVFVSMTARSSSRVRGFALPIAIVICGGLGLLTWKHSAAFRDSEALYTEAVRRVPTSVPAQYLLGVALEKRPGRVNDAIAAFEAAARLNPEAAAIRQKLGAALLQVSSRRREAIDQLEAALRLEPQSEDTKRLLASAWFDEGRASAMGPDGALEATAAYERALELKPDFAEAHFNLGNIFRTPAQQNDAVRHFEAAVRLKPDFAAAHTNLGILLARQPGRLAEAIAHFEAAVQADPNFAPAKTNLARARQLREDHGAIQGNR